GTTSSTIVQMPQSAALFPFVVAQHAAPVAERYTTAASVHPADKRSPPQPATTPPNANTTRKYVCFCVHACVHYVSGNQEEHWMSAIKVGVREFRERIASFLESDSPVAVTRRGETLGV